MNDRFDLEFIGEGDDHQCLFLLGSYTDQESGGWMVSEVHRNLAIVLQQKARKIAPYRGKYSEWWLALPDYIGFGLSDPTDQSQFREMPVLVHDWNRVILINPTNLDVSFEVSQVQ